MPRKNIWLGMIPKPLVSLVPSSATNPGWLAHACGTKAPISAPAFVAADCSTPEACWRGAYHGPVGSLSGEPFPPEQYSPSCRHQVPVEAIVITPEPLTVKPLTMGCSRL